MPKKGQKKQPLSYQRWLARLAECRETGWYSVRICATCGTERYAVHHGCGLTTCPICAEDYSRRLTARLLEQCTWLEAHKRRGYNLRVITLTLRPSGDLRADVIRIQRGIRQLWRHIGGADRGLLAALEVGQGRNVHAHCIYYGPYLSQTGLSELWRQITGDSYVVWIEALRGKALIKAVLEVGKYITKGLCSGDPRYNYAIYLAMYSRRRVLEYGLMLGTMSSDPPSSPCPVCGCTETEAGPVLTRDEYLEWRKKGLDTG